MSHDGCALVWHFQPRVVIFTCPTHYRASSVKCRSLDPTQVCCRTASRSVRFRRVLRSRPTSSSSLSHVENKSITYIHVVGCGGQIQTRRHFHTSRQKYTEKLTLLWDICSNRSHPASVAMRSKCTVPQQTSVSKCKYLSDRTTWRSAINDLHPFYRAMLCIRGTSHGPESVCPSQVDILSKRMNESSWFLARELPSTSPTLC